MSRSSSRPAVPRAARLAAIVAGALLLLAACGAGPTTTPAPTPSPSATPAPATAPPTPSATPAPSDDLAALYREIEDQVIAERGLEAKERRDPVVLSEEELRVRIEEQFRAENPPEEIAVAQETLQALGLLPADADLEQLYVDMLSSQVAGFYDPETKELYVVSRSGSIGATEEVTYAHEFTHALQDQHFGLEGIDVDAVGQGDRSLGRLGLVEGDATLLMTRWMVSNLTPAELQELLEVDPDDLAQLEALPAILRETLLFPYQQGGVFANGVWMAGGWEAIDRAYERLPDSTEQILHPVKSEAAEKPVAVDLDGAALAAAMGAGWSGTPEDTFGEFQISIWLRENGVRALDAQRAAAGWGGDRLAYLRGPDGAYALVWRTAWDSAAEASEFQQAAGTVVGDGDMPGTVGVTSAREVVVVLASDGDALNRAVDAADLNLPD